MLSVSVSFFLSGEPSRHTNTHTANWCFSYSVYILPAASCLLIKCQEHNAKYHSIITQPATYIWNVCFYFHRFSQGLHLCQIDMIQDGIAGSSRTLSKMSKKLRNVCNKTIRKRERRGKLIIGGQREFIMIDESNYCHKRKVCMKHGALLEQTLDLVFLDLILNIPQKSHEGRPLWNFLLTALSTLTAIYNIYVQMKHSYR